MLLDLIVMHPASCPLGQGEVMSTVSEHLIEQSRTRSICIALAIGQTHDQSKL